ncbi:MAG: UxaA family hydrolase [Deinococcales bacterium]|jgi:(2R)-sulfolactate sulfo-lyase subunit alpha
MAHSFLVHNEGDDVGVVTEDVTNGQEVIGVFMDSGGEVRLVAGGDIPLGHKIALRALHAGDDVTEYGTRVAVASADIASGDYVHTHNVRSARW